LYFYPPAGKDGLGPKDLNSRFPYLQTPIRNLSFGPVLLKCRQSQMRQRLPSGVAWRLLESGHWLKVDVEVEVEVGTRFELGEIANGAP